MTRRPREISDAGMYHVIARGNGKQLLFDSDEDRLLLLELLSLHFGEEHVDILAWCLMDNHVHICLAMDPEEGLDGVSRAMQVIQTKYAKRFNSRTGHVGHVFQTRYASMPIRDERYLLQAVRYIHNNPQKAGICPASSYRWSSYHEYLGEPGICDTSIVLDLVGGPDGFVEYSRASTEEDYCFKSGRFLADAQLPAAAKAVLGDMDPRLLKALPREERDRHLVELRGIGMTVGQVARLTGIGASTVTRATTHLVTVTK